MSLACEMQGDVWGLRWGCRLRTLSDYIVARGTIGVKDDRSCR
jgi:hypothetical protein